MMTLEEVWGNLRQDPEIKATMEEVDKSYKLFKKIENLIVSNLEAKLAVADDCADRYWEQLKVEQNYINQLKQQLAEKEKFLERIMSGEYIPANIAEKSLKLSNQTAIAELEKVRSKIARLDVSPDESNRLIPALDNYTNGFHKSRFKIVNILDQQIKELKGEK